MNNFVANLNNPAVKEKSKEFVIIDKNQTILQDDKNSHTNTTNNQNSIPKNITNNNGNHKPTNEVNSKFTIENLLTDEYLKKDNGSSNISKKVVSLNESVSNKTSNSNISSKIFNEENSDSKKVLNNLTQSDSKKNNLFGDIDSNNAVKKPKDDPLSNSNNKAQNNISSNKNISSNDRKGNF